MIRSPGATPPRTRFTGCQWLMVSSTPQRAVRKQATLTRLMRSPSRNTASTAVISGLVAAIMEVLMAVVNFNASKNSRW